MKLSKACSIYGADMGRPGNQSERTEAVKFHLRRVRLDAGGYDNGGAYWGIGAPLYRAWGGAPAGCYPPLDSEQEIFVRAADRPAAKAEVLKTFPRASFYPAPDSSGGQWWTSSSGLINLRLTREQAAGAGHGGQCDADVAELSKAPTIARQLAAVDPEALRRELKEYGAWDADELADHAQNLQRLLWLACSDLNDGNT